jgi:hypothetical protein
MVKGSFRVVMLSAMISLPIEANAFGNDEHWVSGFGMGVKEAIITKGPGNQIYVACDEGSGTGSSISFMLAGNGPTGDAVTLTFDGGDPQDFWIADGQIISDCRACAATFNTVIDLFKKHQSVHVRFENGTAARFSLARSSSAIGTCSASF